MKRERAIPENYMTVGELARKMGTTVRTLQYYDREGIFSPSAESSGGRRLYTYRDMIRLHQILSLKSLGFSLKDIKNKLVSLETPEDVADALTHQADAVKEKIQSLTESLKAIEALKSEVQSMQSVDFKKYADIIINQQMGNEYYWLIKHFDNKMLDHIRTRFDIEGGMAFMNRFQQLNDEAMELKENGVPPQDPEAQILAEKFWNLVLDFTDGDMSMLPSLMEFAGQGDIEKGWGQRQAEISTYLEPALSIYFSRSGIDPFGEE